MAIAHEFDYVKPGTPEEICSLLEIHGNKACILAGGTDLVVQLREDVRKPGLLIDIKGIENYDKLHFDGRSLFIGPRVTFTDLIKHPEVKNHFRVLWEAATTVASCGVRNRATLAGNICSAVPSLDSAPALMLYDATVHLRSNKGTRDISIHDWFAGPKKTNMLPVEFVTGISLKIPDGKHASIYKKLGRYSGEDLAQAGIGILLTDAQEVRIAFCAVGPVPVRATRIEAVMNGKKINDGLIEEAARMIPAEISPITDIRASKEYRTHMMQLMFERAMKEVVMRLDNPGVHSEPIV